MVRPLAWLFLLVGPAACDVFGAAESQVPDVEGNLIIAIFDLTGIKGIVPQFWSIASPRTSQASANPK